MFFKGSDINDAQCVVLYPLWQGHYFRLNDDSFVRQRNLDNNNKNGILVLVTCYFVSDI